MRARYGAGAAVVFLLSLTLGSLDVAGRDMSARRVLIDDQGGAIEVEAVHANDKETRDAVRKALRDDARSRMKSATPAMEQHQKQIQYRYENTKSGGRIRIVAKSEEALRAVQDYLRSQKKELKTAKGVTFSFIGNTSLVVIPVNINDHGPLRFLLDTGASNTVLSAAVADDLNIPKGRQEKLVTAAGDVVVTMRIIDAIQIGRSELTRVEIAVADFPLMKTLQVDGILGGDYLRQFKISIDYDHQVVDIEPCCSSEMSMLTA
jgi:predicted aspartyl protease